MSTVTQVRGPVSTIRKTIAMCFPGEVFSQLWNAHIFALYAQMVQQFPTFMPIWGYSSNVYLTRLAMADRLLKADNKPDLVLWVDDDNLLNFDQFTMLAEDLERNPAADLVAGWSWCRPDDCRALESKVSAGRFCGLAVPGVAEGRPCPLTLADLQKWPVDMVPVGYTGFPAVLMRYSLLERLGPDAFMPMIGPGLGAWGFAGEDVAFSRRAVDAGCKLFVDRRVRVPHLKRTADDWEGMPVAYEKRVG